MPGTEDHRSRDIVLVVLGIVFAVLWIGVHVVWAYVSFVANVMANDSGAASTNQQMSLIFGMLGGQIIAAAAGIAGGLAFFWRRRRKLLLILFAIMFLVGALWQIVAFQSFFSATGSVLASGRVPGRSARCRQTATHNSPSDLTRSSEQSAAIAGRGIRATGRSRSRPAPPPV